MIDIIIPAFNAHNTLKRTLSSIAMQENIGDIKVTLVDDCSSKPYDELAEYFSNQMNIQVVKMSTNGGPGVARQVGMDHTNGDFIMWMDADDTLISATALLMLTNCMIEKDQDCVYGQFLEESENGTIVVHEQCMVWMFAKLYRRSFLDHFSIRFNETRANEDTGFNSIVKGCTSRIWYIPQPVYIWHFKANSITRINEGMYGFDSGYKGYLDNMIWQIKELAKRFVNKNYILSEAVGIMCTLYFFHEENKVKYPANAEVSMQWIRGYYQTCYKDYEEFITQEVFDQTFIRVQSGQDIAKRIVPTATVGEFMKEVRKPYNHKVEYEAGGATPTAYIPAVTPDNLPVEITEFKCKDEKIDVDSNTNIPLHAGMNKILHVNDDVGKATPSIRRYIDGSTVYTDGNGTQHVQSQEKAMNVLELREDESGYFHTAPREDNSGNFHNTRTTTTSTDYSPFNTHYGE